MTSYQCLKKKTHIEISATHFTRVHGLPSSKDNEKLVKECWNAALRYNISYNRSYGFRLLPFIIRAARFAADNPLLPPFVQPSKPPNSPVLPANPTAAQYARLRTIITWRRGIGPSSKTFVKEWAKTCVMPLTWNFYAGLKHRMYEILILLYRQYIVHLEKNFCPLDAQATSDLKAHYNMGMEPNKQL